MKYLIGILFEPRSALKNFNIGFHSRLKEGGFRWLQRNIYLKKKEEEEEKDLWKA